MLPHDREELANVDGRQLTDSEYQLGVRRQAVISALLESPHCSQAAISEAAIELQCSARTVWRLLKKYRASFRLEDLVPAINPRTNGKTFLDPKTEMIIDEVIEQYHLSRMKPTFVQTTREVRRRCFDAGLPLPAYDTVRRRIQKIPDIEIMASREGRKAARYRYRAMGGKTPNTGSPLERVQIDHTTVDIIVVDEVYREPLRRPYITIAIDEYSRAVLGFHLSLDPPSATSVGLCLVHAILPKDEWAGRIGLTFPWPMHGRPDLLYVDNGADFHSEAVDRGCTAWGMKISYRPKGMPHFGGIVERMIRTAMSAMKTLPGATGGSIKERGDRDPAKDAAMTLAELELYFATFFAGQYHRTPHSAHGMSPNARWNLGIFGNVNSRGRGLPPIVNDPQRLLIDFLPLTYRHLSTSGFVWDHITYLDDVLRPYIANDQKMPFLVRRDPRDVSTIWFLAPDDNRYYQIRTRDISRPSVSLWELQHARRRLKSAGRSDYHEKDLFEAISAQHVITASAKRRKVEARQERLAIERRRIHQKELGLRTAHSTTPIVSQAPWRSTPAPDEDGGDIFEIED